MKDGDDVRRERDQSVVQIFQHKTEDEPEWKVVPVYQSVQVMAIVSSNPRGSSRTRASGTIRRRTPQSKCPRHRSSLAPATAEVATHCESARTRKRSARTRGSSTVLIQPR